MRVVIETETSSIAIDDSFADSNRENFNRHNAELLDLAYRYTMERIGIGKTHEKTGESAEPREPTNGEKYWTSAERLAAYRAYKDECDRENADYAHPFTWLEMPFRGASVSKTDEETHE